jgi:hypothetical protein
MDAAYEYEREEAEIREDEMQRDHDEMATDDTIDRAWLDECRRAWRNEQTAEDLRQQAERDRRYTAWETRRAALVAAGQLRMAEMSEAQLALRLSRSGRV